MQKELGAAPLLEVKRVPIPKGWTIAVDSCTPHAGAPAGPEFGPGGFRVHVYAVTRAIDRVHPDLEGEQDHTVNLLSIKNPYFPLLCWAQKQSDVPFSEI